MKKTVYFALILMLLFPVTGFCDDPPQPGDGVDEFGVPNDIHDDMEPADIDDALADVTDDDQSVSEEPSYKNPAQAHHAANLQEQALASDPELNAAADEVADARQEQTEAGLALREAFNVQTQLEAELQAARQIRAEAKLAYEEALTGNDPDAIEAALQTLQDARKGVRDARTALEEATESYGEYQQAYQEARDNFLSAESNYADMLGERTGVLGAEIQDMRQVQKMGWGQIAHYLGVEPRYLGRRLGHLKNGKISPSLPDVDPIEEDPVDADLVMQAVGDLEIREATKRNTKTGWSKNHGLKTDNSQSSKRGMGIAKTSGAGNAADKSSKNVGKGSEAKSNKGNSKGSAGSSASGKGNSGKTQSASQSQGPSSKSNNGNKGSSNSSKSSKDKSNNGKSGNSNKGGNGKK